MDAYSYATMRHQTQERFDRRVHEASLERLAREVRGTTPTTRAKERLQTALSSWLGRPRFARASTEVRLEH